MHMDVQSNFNLNHILLTVLLSYTTQLPIYLFLSSFSFLLDTDPPSTPKLVIDNHESDMSSTLNSTNSSSGSSGEDSGALGLRIGGGGGGWIWSWGMTVALVGVVVGTMAL